MGTLRPRNTCEGSPSDGGLAGQRVAFVGKLAGMSRREASQMARDRGAVVVSRADRSVDLIVVGEEDLAVASGPGRWLDDALRDALERGHLEVITETQFWERLGLVETGRGIHRLYTPAMLAELVGVPVAVIRRWHRRGLIQPVREVRRLAYFDFQEVATARRLAELMAAGVPARSIEKQLETLSRFLPEVERPLAQLSVLVEGQEILLRQGDGLVEPGGQRRFDFRAADEGATEDGRRAGPGAAGGVIRWPDAAEEPEEDRSPERLCRMAETLEESGDLAAAAEVYRAAMAAGGPSAELCFQVAELLYRLGDLGGARERYYMAIELDEDYVEARANLGCLLAETGQPELAVAAFQGALAYHPDYADVHYHLARTLEEMGRSDEARGHWRSFLDLAPDSPWAQEARARLECRPG